MLLPGRRAGFLMHIPPEEHHYFAVDGEVRRIYDCFRVGNFYLYYAVG